MHLLCPHSKSGGTIRRNVESEYYIVSSSDIPEGSGVLRVTVRLSLFYCEKLMKLLWLFLGCSFQ